MAETSHSNEGGFKLTLDQLALMEESGWPLSDPAQYQAPATIEEFKDRASLNNFRTMFWRSGSDMPVPKYNNKFIREGQPHFERFRILYPELLEEMRLLVGVYERVYIDIARNNGNDGAIFTREQHDFLYENIVYPKLYEVWCMATQLVDKSDSDYQHYVKLYGEDRGVSCAINQ